MILSTLELENYRQYRSERIEFPERGIVGVIGANGVGKTTLFEAIEWCLFAPRTIGNSDVPPRGIPGATKVTLTLFDPRDGVSWVVERGLTKSGLKTAEIYRQDNEAAPVAQGTGPVTRYIESRLIGLSHQAFVSTFFTRQKELSFFGSLGPSDRRREVSRLLGFDVIRAAQTEIADEGNARRGRADALAVEVERTLKTRDFEREIVDARIEAGRAAADRDAAQIALQERRQAQDAAEADHGRLMGMQRQDHALHVRLLSIEREIALTEQRRATAEAALADLARKDTQRDALVPVAADEGRRLEVVAAFDADRQRAQTLSGWRRDIARLDEAILQSVRAMRAAVDGVPAVRWIPGWAWTDADAVDPAGAAARLQRVVAGLDPHGAIRRSAALDACRRAADEADAEAQRLRRYEEKLDAYERQRDALLHDGDPAAAAQAARSKADAARTKADTAKAAATSAERERKSHLALIGRLREQPFDTHCPTCTRPFTDRDAEATIRTLAAKAEELGIAAEAERWAMSEATAAVEAAVATEQAARQRTAELQGIEAKIAVGRQHVAEQSERTQLKAAECAGVLRAAGLPEPPPAAEVAAARERADLLQAVAGAAATIAQHGADAERGGNEITRLGREIDALGPVNYDPAAHAAASDALQHARDARARIASIDAELDCRPEREAERDAALSMLAEHDAAREAVVRERADVGFDADALATVESRLVDARAAARAANESWTAAETALARALDRETRLTTDQAVFVERQNEAIATRREADDLLRMRDEFNGFERFVAEQLGPRIADYAGELIDRVTNQIYSRVELDQDYGLEIFDGDECFPLTSFSGGERDVFALCARLALSRVIGGQAVNRPRFLVLDEVFGSLDQERRRHLLDMLGRLTQDSEDFRQLFVISHVEDVQESPAMSELWRVVDVDGHSRVETRQREPAADLALAGSG